MQSAQASIDPTLGYNFLLNGVIHVVPFLLRIWNKKDFEIERVNDTDLQNAGIKNAKDRKGVLKSIKDFLSVNSNRKAINNNNNNNDDDNGDDDDDEACCSKDVNNDISQKVPTAPQESITKSPTSSASSSSRDQVTATNAVECVVCMDAQTRVIFLPCGHLCCCIDCAKDLNLCPMCRSLIDRKIKVIQP